MSKNNCVLFLNVLCVALVLGGCNSQKVAEQVETNTETLSNVENQEEVPEIEYDTGTEKVGVEDVGTGTQEMVIEYADTLLPEERESIVVGKLSPEHIYYQEVTTFDPACAEYIEEISIFDQEIGDTFVVHVSLPPEYDGTKKYPMVVMTDGVWRLSDHPELRPLMVSGEIDDVILVSVGYPNDYDYQKIRERDLVKDPESYLHFLVDNLVPYLSEIYSVDPENMTLTGHSYGGYWGFYALFHSDTIGKNTFCNYYIGSPSFQARTGSDEIEDFEEAYFSRQQSLPCNVYVTVGDQESVGFIMQIENFINHLQERGYEGLNLSYEVIEGHGHDTVFKPSIKNTMYMFYGNNQ